MGLYRTYRTYRIYRGSQWDHIGRIGHIGCVGGAKWAAAAAWESGRESPGFFLGPPPPPRRRLGRNHLVSFWGPTLRGGESPGFFLGPRRRLEALFLGVRQTIWGARRPSRNRLVPSLGAFTWCLHLVPSQGAFARCLRKVPSQGAFARCLYLVPSPGTGNPNDANSSRFSLEQRLKAVGVYAAIAHICPLCGSTL